MEVHKASVIHIYNIMRYSGDHTLERRTEDNIHSIPTLTPLTHSQRKAMGIFAFSYNTLSIVSITLRVWIKLLRIFITL